MAIEAAFQKVAEVEGGGPVIKGPLAATDFGKKLRELSSDKRNSRLKRPGLR